MAGNWIDLWTYLFAAPPKTLDDFAGESNRIGWFRARVGSGDRVAGSGWPHRFFFLRVILNVRFV